MATPIENNTEGLAEILRAVNDLPNAEGGGGVLCVTADYGTMIASHSPAEILEAVNSGKSVNLCVRDTAALIVLPLVGCEASLQQATFCNTVSADGEVGTQFGIIHAVVRGDKTVTFANDGSALSMCVPVAENTDVGKVLSVSADGLAWVKPSEGGSSGASGIPVIDLRELGFPEVDGPDYIQTVTIDQSAFAALKSKMETGFVKLIFAGMGGVISAGLPVTTVEIPSMTQYAASGFDVTMMRYTFEIGGENGMYGARFAIDQP